MFKNISELDEEVNKLKQDPNFPFPKILHQVWMNDDPNIPEKWKKGPEEWKKYHSDWFYILWNRELSDDLVKNYEPEFYPFYTKFKYEIQRIDSVRYCFLKRYGGVYCDLDNYPNKNIEEFFINTNCEAYFNPSSDVPWIYNNNLMMGNPRRPIWNILIENCKRKNPFWRAGKYLQVMGTTGPIMLTKAIIDYNGILCRLPRVRFNTQKVKQIGTNFGLTKDAVILNLKGGSWCEADANFLELLYRNVTSIVLLIILLFLIFIIICSNTFSNCRR